jgi:hypothetical protein
MDFRLWAMQPLMQGDISLLGNLVLPYANGSGFTNSGAVTAFNDLTSGGSAKGSSYAFLGDSSVAANGALTLTPVPEASTIAVLFAGGFVGGLVIKRVRQRRQQVAAVAGLPKQF